MYSKVQTFFAISAALICCVLFTLPIDYPSNGKKNTAKKFIILYCFILAMSNCALASNQHGSALNQKCSVYVSRKIGPVQSGIFGSNVEWFHDGNGLIKNEKLDSDYIALARKQNVTSLRFPGGTLSDFYHWADGVGPMHKRPITEHPTDDGKSSNRFGTNEFLEFCNLTGAIPFITVNVGTGTANEAANWVQYCKKIIPVRYWQLGNELYLNTTKVEKSISLSAEQYSERIISFAKKMKKVDPDIKISGIGTAPSLRFDISRDRDWTRKVLQIAGSYIDLIAVHNGYFPVLIGPVPKNKKVVYEALWAAPEAFNRSLIKLDSLIFTFNLPDSFGIAVTEWGPFFSFDNPDWLNHVKTMGSALFCARMIQVFLSNPRVQFAHYFKFNGDCIMSWIGYDKKPKIPFYVIKLFRDHFGTQLIQSSIISPLFSSKQVGLTTAENNVPYLTTIASLDDNKKNVFLNIINRSWETTYDIDLHVMDFAISDSMMTAWSISAATPLSHNGPGLSHRWPVEVKEPKKNAETIAIKKTLIPVNRSVSIKPCSIITIQISGTVIP